jgi:hypothetical protein
MTILVAAALLLACAGDGQQAENADTVPPANGGKTSPAYRCRRSTPPRRCALLVRQVQFGPRVPAPPPTGSSSIGCCST